MFYNTVMSYVDSPDFRLIAADARISSERREARLQAGRAAAYALFILDRAKLGAEWDAIRATAEATDRVNEIAREIAERALAASIPTDRTWVLSRGTFGGLWRRGFQKGKEIEKGWRLIGKLPDGTLDYGFDPKNKGELVLTPAGRMIVSLVPLELQGESQNRCASHDDIGHPTPSGYVNMLHATGETLPFKWLGLSFTEEEAVEGLANFAGVHGLVDTTI